MSKTATAPQSALDCDTPRAARLAARLPRPPYSPALAVPSETTAGGNAGTRLRLPVRRLVVRHGSAFLRSVVFPLQLVLPSLSPRSKQNPCATPEVQKPFFNEPEQLPPALSASSSAPKSESPRSKPRRAFGNYRETPASPPAAGSCRKSI